MSILDFDLGFLKGDNKEIAATDREGTGKARLMSLP